MSLFSFRRGLNDNAGAQKQSQIKNLLAYRDTWQEMPYENFSMQRVILRARIEKYKQTMVKLVRSENGFRRKNKDDMSPSEQRLRTVQSALNKLTEQNYEAILTSIRTPELIYDEAVCNGAVNIIFNKAVAEPVFSGLYARVIEDITHYERSLRSDAEKNFQPVNDDAAGDQSVSTDAAGSSCGNDAENGGRTDPEREKAELNKSVVRLAVINRCQSFFEAFVEQGPPCDEEEAENLKKRNMSNIKFVGELYMRSCISDKVIGIVCDMVFGELDTLTDVNVEMVINLLSVVGKKYEDCIQECREKRDQIWERMSEAQDRKQLSTRIRFLIQNLLERRADGWKTKNAVVPSSANSSKPASGQQSGGNQNLNNKNTTQQRNSDAPTNAAGRPGWQNNAGGGGMNRPNNNNNNNKFHQQRLEGYNEKAMGASIGTHSPHSALSPVGAQGFSELSAEERKLMALATPPQALSDEIEKDFLSFVRDAHIDGSWDAASNSIKECMKKCAVNEHTTAMCAAYAVIKKICTTNDANDRALFTDSLNQCPCFDTSASSRGFAWFLTYAIVQGLQEDNPNLHKRFREALMSTKTMTFCVVLRDVLARTGNYLDALSTRDETELDQQNELVNLWSSIVCSWKEHRPEEEVRPMAVLEALKDVKQRPFMQDIAPDCLAELLNGGWITAEVVREWVKKAEEANPKAKEALKVLVGQLKDLVPDS